MGNSMKARHRWFVTLLGPFAVMLLFGGLLWQSGRHAAKDGDRPAQTGDPSGESGAPRASRLDLSTLAPGDSLPEWEASQGNFRLVELEGRTVLELSHEPMEEGRLLWSRLIPKTGAVRARMWGPRTRRNAPRFSVGVVASSAIWLRATPLKRVVEIVGKEETVVASVPWSAVSERPVWLELRLLRGEGPGAPGRVEGRVWFDEEERPEAPTIEATLGEEIGFARAVVAGAPYALKPVYFDRLEVEAQ